MPEALGNRLQPAQPSFDIKRRDEREEAAKASKKMSEQKLADEASGRSDKNAKHTEDVRAKSEEAKKITTNEEVSRKTEDNLEKQRTQDKVNPDSGNIINVVA